MSLILERRQWVQNGRSSRWKRNATVLDNQIDQLVYELYGLTDEEIRMVEEATKK